MQEMTAEKEEKQREEMQVVVFKLGCEEYAMDILNVQEIIRLLNITRIPRTQEYVEGVVNLRGSIIPLINLHTKFKIKAGQEEEERRIIVCQFDDVKAGIIVDEVLEVIRLNTAEIEQVDELYASINADNIEGIAKVNERLLIMLDMEKILLGDTAG